MTAALGPQTACVLYFAGAHFAGAALPLERVVALAHEQGVPVIVDAAAQIPPISNLWHFTKEVGAGHRDLQRRQGAARPAIERPDPRQGRDYRGVPRERRAESQHSGAR